MRRLKICKGCLGGSCEETNIPCAAARRSLKKGKKRGSRI